MLSLSIARRYLLSRKSHSAVNIICGVAVGGMAIAVMAIVVVLSVFNGFASLAEKQMGLFDPDHGRRTLRRSTRGCISRR